MIANYDTKGLMEMFIELHDLEAKRIEKFRDMEN